MRARKLLEAFGLIAVVGFVVAVGYLPHADSFSNPPPPGPSLVRIGETYWAWLGNGTAEDYEYPIHVDENVHWEAMASAERAESLRHHGVFFKVPETGPPFALRGLVHEQGFHVALIMFQELTGIAWLDLFRFLPALWMGVTALLLWALLRPWPGALVAAALVALIPTTPRFLGPALLVPIGFGLPWILATAMLLGPASQRARGSTLLLAVIVWGFFLHLAIGFASLLVVLCALPFVQHRRNVLRLAAVAFVPVLALWQAFAADVGGEAARIGGLPTDYTVWDHIGVPFLALWVLGCALVAYRPPAGARLPVVALTGASMVVLGLMLVNLVGDFKLYALYDRWHQPFALLGCAPVAHALWTLAEVGAEGAVRVVRRVRRMGPAGSAAPWQAAAAVMLCVAGFAGATDVALSWHIRQPYYHVIDDADWAAFVWAAEHVNETYDVFLSHPWKAVVFAAMTGKEPYTYLAPGAPPAHGEDWDAYLQGQHQDGAWFVERDISVVIAPLPVAAPEFETTGPMTSQLRWEFAQELHELSGR